MNRCAAADYGTMVYLRKNLQLCAKALGKYDTAKSDDDKALYLASAKHLALVCVKQLKGIRPKIKRSLTIDACVDAVVDYCTPETSVFRSLSDDELANLLGAFCDGEVVGEIDTFIREFDFQ